MTRGLLAVALACGLLAACATPDDAFFAAPETPGGFVYVAESYDLYPTRRFEGEARRLQELDQYLASNNLCPNGYAIEQREESVTGSGGLARYFSGAIFRVTYRGRCTESRPEEGTPPAAAPGAAHTTSS